MQLFEYRLYPNISFMSHEHLLFTVPALIIVVLIGMLLPLVLILYPARCGTWLGARLQFGRLHNAVKTFIEAMNGSYKDGLAGTRDYHACQVSYCCQGVLSLLAASSEGTDFPAKLCFRLRCTLADGPCSVFWTV